MHPRHFDRLTTVLAHRQSTPSAASEICLFQFTATVRRGPTAGTTYDGVLALAADANGAIDGAGFVPVQTGRVGPRVPVVGQVIGRAINLLFRLADGRALYGVGTLEHELAECRGSAGGPLVGPDPGDGGDWDGKQPLVIVMPAKEGAGCSSGLTCSNCRTCAGLAYHTSPSSDQVTAACRASLPGCGF